MTSSQPPPESDDVTKQLVELEHKLAFQQRAFDELNSVVLDQQADLERLRREVQSLRQLLQGVVDNGTGEDLPHEKPPHY